MNTDQALILWNTRWALVEGMVVCGACLHRQCLSQSNQPFDHGTDCANDKGAGIWPWAELHDIFDTARG